MIEVTFTESAGGGLKAAQTYGKGKYSGGAISVFYRNEDGSQPTQDALREAQRRYEEQARKEWEEAIPIGGNPGDVYCLSLGLSMGDIRVDAFGEERKEFLQSMMCIDDEDFANCAAEQLEAAKSGLEAILKRAKTGETVRAWYSDNPDEICGFYHLMSLLDDTCQISAVKLQPIEENPDGTVSIHNGWGEIKPGDWGRYLSLERTVTPSLRRAYALDWRNLQGENLPLRAVLNGKLVGVPEDFYDSFILNALDREDAQFHEGRLIGRILVRCQLGIGDWLIHQRIENQIRLGRLTVVTPAEKSRPVYHRILRKASK